MQNLPVGIFKIDSNNQIVYANRCYCALAGYPKEKILGKNWLDLINPDDRNDILQILREKLKTRRTCKFQFRFTQHDKSEIWVLCNLSPQSSKKSNANYIGTITDITELKKMQTALQNLARFDPLTQLPNRYLFEDTLMKSMYRTKRNKNKLALFYIDLDNFKEVNDVFGHDVGDSLLKKVGDRLKQNMRIQDCIVRLGGDEFAIILEDIYNINAISMVAQRMIDDFKKSFVILGHEIVTTLSIGISVFPEEETTHLTIVQHADQALYHSKKSGGNCYNYYNKKMQERLNRYMLLTKHLRNALAENQFELYYQPKIDALENSLVGIEALLRWNNSIVNNPSPAEFISIAEETGLMNQIGTWVIKEALHQYKQWYDKIAEMRYVKLTINFSSSQLNDSNIIESLSKVISEAQVPTNNIIFEFTETAVMKKNLENNSILQTLLLELGVGMSIDDFGTAYSSLPNLKQLPVRELKINKTFIDAIGNRTNNELIMKAIINLAKTLKLDVTAEGVETKAQLDFLLENHCRIIQGYYFSKPLSVSDMTTFINRTLTRQKVR